MSSQPSPSRIIPIRYAGYRACINEACGHAQFYVEVSTQMMCKPCQVDISYHRAKPEYTVICRECRRAFTTTIKGTSIKYCSDKCRRVGDIHRKAERRAAEKQRAPLPTRVCAHTGCSAVFIPRCQQTVYCSPACRDAKRKEREKANAKPRKVFPARVCGREGCETVFTPTTSRGRYCSVECREMYWSEHRKETGR